VLRSDTSRRLDQANAAWRTVPDPRRKLVEHEPGLPCIPPVRVVLIRVKMVRLGSLPNYVVALTAVPDLGARPFSTRPPMPGAYATACGPVPRAKGDHKERRLEINPARRENDRRKRDIGRKYAAHVPFLLILN
jgi:hypothetical protein